MGDLGLLSLVVFAVVLGTSIWAAVDASNLGAKPGRLGGGFTDMGPAGWFFACLFLWILAMPLYLTTRSTYIQLKEERDDLDEEDDAMRAQAIAERSQEEQRPTKACPFCGETILAIAIKCKHCQSDLRAAG